VPHPSCDEFSLDGQTQKLLHVPPPPGTRPGQGWGGGWWVLGPAVPESPNLPVERKENFGNRAQRFLLPHFEPRVQVAVPFILRALEWKGSVVM
jgi:hypothetical protein